MKLNHLGIATSNIQKAEKFVKNTHNVINTIGGMSYGSIELRDFLETFQIVDISH